MFSAAVAAGATLDELLKWESGGYPQWFMAHVVAWHRGDSLVKTHQEDAVNRKMSKK